MKISYNGLISIIVPVYNPPLEKLRRCVQSIFQQVYTNIEIIIVDDGSNKIIQDFLDDLTDSRVKVYHQKNSGVSVARNEGIKKAKGEYISFVDADDYIDKNWINNSLTFLENKYDVIFGRVLRCNEQTLYKTKQKSYKLLFKDYSYNSLIEVQKMLMLNNAVSPLLHLPYLDLGPCGKLYRSEIIKSIKFPINIAIGEDQVFNHRIIKRSDKVMVTNYKAYYYIENEKSAGHSFRSDALEVMMKAMKLIYDELINPQKEINDFYYLVILNTLVALSLELTNNKIRNLKLVSSIYKKTCSPLNDSIHNIKIDKSLRLKARIRIFIVKYHLLYILILLKK